MPESATIEGDELRVCPVCEERKPLEDFPKNGDRRKYAYCKPCHVDVQRRQKLKNFGITEEEYDRMVEAQDGCCAICKRPPKRNRLAVDHDHTTGLVRGGLCWSCNQGLGFWADDPERLRSALAYVLSPPAVASIGERYGAKGRVTSKRWRKAK